MEFAWSAFPAFTNTLVIYLLIILGIRTLGRRQTGQLTALDLLIVLLLGSAVETAMIGPAPGPSKELFHDPNVSLAAGLLSAGTLLVANRVLGQLMVRSKRLRHLIVGAPIILVHDGVIVHENMRRAGFTEADAMQALRSRGYSSPEEVCFAVLEPNGEFHAMPRQTLVRRTRRASVIPESFPPTV
jgi:uncharacterized membrane protein YcaP (DUF421 family)